MPGTRKLGRASDHRKAMLRAMVTFLLENGKIETTVTRAKEVRAMTEKMITIAKKDDLAAKRQVLAYVTKEDGTILLPRDRSLPMSPRKMSRRSSSTRSLRSMLTSMAVTPGSPRPARVAEMPQKCASSNSSEFDDNVITNEPCAIPAQGLF